MLRMGWASDDLGLTAPTTAPTFGKGMRAGQLAPRRRSRRLLVLPANAPAGRERTHDGRRRRMHASLFAALACICLLGPAGVARAVEAPTPDPAPTGGTSPDPAPTGGAAAPVPVKHVAPSREPVTRPVTAVVVPSATNSSPVTTVQRTVTPAPTSVAPSTHPRRRAERRGSRRTDRRARSRHKAAASPGHSRVVDPPRPEAAVRFLGHLPTTQLVGGPSDPAHSSVPLLPAAIALFLIVLAEGPLLRLTAQLPRRP